MAFYRGRIFAERGACGDIFCPAAQGQVDRPAGGGDSAGSVRNMHVCGDDLRAGSTFKNLPDKPAWKIVQELGYQNKEINGAKMSEKHANFMVNTGTAKAKDLENLGNSIIKDAKEKLDLNLEWEVKIIGKEL